MREKGEGGDRGERSGRGQEKGKGCLAWGGADEGLASGLRGDRCSP